MSKTFARAVLSALDSTAVTIVSISETEEVAYLYRASTNRYLAQIDKGFDELFEESFVRITSYNGKVFTCSNLSEFKEAAEKISGYPTGADKRKNWSKPVYVDSDY